MKRCELCSGYGQHSPGQRAPVPGGPYLLLSLSFRALWAIEETAENQGTLDTL